VVSRIVCGGQSGADRAAVDFALACGVPYGGWVPRGGWAEDFPDAPGLLARYLEFRATPSDNPDVRTMWNVRDSTATLVVRRDTSPSSGTDATVRAVAHFARPLLDVDALDSVAVNRLRTFLLECRPPIALNVAGARESESPGIYEATLRLLEASAGLFSRRT
jgi:Circularly permutated YpsA SLOG family